MLNKYVLSILLLLLVISGQATIITCSNNVLTVGQYSNLQTAVSAANYGDTVYVTPSPTNYGSITVNKKITLMGGGWYIPGSPNVSRLNDITIDSSFTTNSVSGMHFIGLNFRGLYINNSRTANNFIIERCYTCYNTNSCCYELNVFGYGWVIKQSVVDWIGININYNRNLIISNNVFQNGRIVNSNSPTVLISNNIFPYGANGTYYSAISNAIVTNNIYFYWYNGNPAAGCAQCIFNSNISFGLYPFALPGANNSGGSNFDNMDPQFVGSNYATGNNYQSYDQITTNNWNLKPTSPGYRRGTDGTDVGIYGGLFPPVGNFLGVPTLPQILLFNLNTAIIPQGGSINATIKAKKQN